MQDYYSTRKDDVPEQFTKNKTVSHFWSIKQNEISKLSSLDYRALLNQSLFAEHQKNYISAEEFGLLKVGEKKGPVKIIAGMISEIVVRKTKKDRREYAVITLQQDDYQSYIRVWPQELANIDNDPRLISIKEIVSQDLRSLVIFRGQVKFNSFTNTNELVVSDRTQGPLVQYFK